jgi:hypothetical protein
MRLISCLIVAGVLLGLASWAYASKKKSEACMVLTGTSCGADENAPAPGLASCSGLTTKLECNGTTCYACDGAAVFNGKFCVMVWRNIAQPAKCATDQRTLNCGKLRKGVCGWSTSLTKCYCLTEGAPEEGDCVFIGCTGLQ